MYCIQALTILYLSYYHSPVAIESRILGGMDLSFDLQYFLVKLKAHHEMNEDSTCSGSIIDSTWIVTSAHCFAPDVENVTVFHQEEDNEGVIAKVDKHNVIIHPKYKVGDESIKNRRFDIALLKTTSSINLSVEVQPVRLSDGIPRENQSVIIAGYGYAEEDLFVPREGFTVVSRCPFVHNGSLICIFDSVRATSGDSGGPLLSKGRLAGIISGSCKQVHVNRPCLSVFTSLAPHLKWIRTVSQLE